MSYNKKKNCHKKLQNISISNGGLVSQPQYVQSQCMQCVQPQYVQSQPQCMPCIQPQCMPCIQPQYMPCVQPCVQQSVQPTCPTFTSDTIDTLVANLNPDTDKTIIIQPPTSRQHSKVEWGAYIKSINGTGGDIPGVIVNKVVSDSVGDIYVQATFGKGGVEIYDKDNELCVTVTGNFNTGIIVKYDGSGNFKWCIKIWNDTDDLYTSGIAIDSCDNIVIAVNGINNFSIIKTKPSTNTGLDTQHFNGSQSCAIVKIDNDGNPLWCAEMVAYNSSLNYSSIYGCNITTDNSNNIYIVGNYFLYTGTSSKIFNANGSEFISNEYPQGNNNVGPVTYLMNISHAGICQWFRWFQTNLVQMLFISCVKVINDKIVVSGITYQTIQISKGSTPVSGIVTLCSIPSFCIFVVSFDSGGTPQKITGIGNIDETLFYYNPVSDFYLYYNSNENCVNMSVSSVLELYLTGRYTTIPKFMEGTTSMTDNITLSESNVSLPSYIVSGTNSFLLKMDDDLVPQWVAHVSGIVGSQVYNSVSAVRRNYDTYTDIFVNGLITTGTTINVYNAGSLTNYKSLTLTGSNQAFQAKYTQVMYIVSQQGNANVDGYKGGVDNTNFISSDLTYFNTIVSVGQFIGDNFNFHNSDGTISNTINSGTTTNTNVYISNYYDYGQIIYLQKPICPLKNKIISVLNDNESNENINNIYNILFLPDPNVKIYRNVKFIFFNTGILFTIISYFLDISLVYPEITQGLITNTWVMNYVSD
jgi:hypothetical protein